MNRTGSVAKALADVESLCEKGDYDRALGRVEGARKEWPGNAPLLLWWAKLVQLQEAPTHTLADAKRALQQAAELDRQSPAAAVELGHFLDNVEDDPRAAARAFGQGITAARQLLIEGLLGQAKTLLQLDKRDQALRALVEAHRLADAEGGEKRANFSGRIDELFGELGHMQSV